MIKTALSGIQTSGELHIGNYLGSIDHWIGMQDAYNCLFFLADLHSITNHDRSHNLTDSTIQSAAIYLSSGIDPNKSTIFVQSAIQEHTELAWLLNCVTPMGWLKRMTQFKDKANKGQDVANTGLFTYPILMAADILLYNANIVPVGQDQKQHLELTRNIAIAVNKKFDQNIFVIPEPLIQGNATRIMSLTDGQKKMSKSDIREASRINILDSSDVIIQKIKKAKTDSISHISYDPNTRPEISNLLNIFSAITSRSVDSIVQEYDSKGFAIFKGDLAEVIINKFTPIQDKFQSLMQDTTYIKTILSSGNDRARNIASKTCSTLKSQFGIMDL